LNSDDDEENEKEEEEYSYNRRIEFLPLSGAHSLPMVAKT
jgi:hypothetical protein